jgi:hypothetical protein
MGENVKSFSFRFGSWHARVYASAGGIAVLAAVIALLAALTWPSARASGAQQAGRIPSATW